MDESELLEILRAKIRVRVSIDYSSPHSGNDLTIKVSLMWEGEVIDSDYDILTIPASEPT